MKRVVVNICRLLLAAVFILSGFVKAVDPRGTQYKIEDYLLAWHMNGVLPDIAILLLSVGLSVMEFSIGIFLLFAIRRRLTSRLAVIMLGVMTPLTLWLALTNPVSDCRETFVKIGNKEAYNDGREIDRFWDIKDGENWYYRPEAQGWTDDVKWEFEPLGKSFFPLDSFDNEVDKSNLSKYYVGMERVLDVNCWHFFVDNEDGVTQYWVDPANGCTLKRQVNSETPREVTVYDLKYTKLTFGPYFKKGLHDTRR